MTYTMAQDYYERYFSEKLWEMIPAVYRDEDGKADRPGVLRALIEVMAKEAAELRHSQDRLWEDQFIELCDDWAIPYLAELLGTRMVSAQNKRGRRADVAKTIYYRRRKGTVRVLEELISDIAGWEGKVIENFQRLARSRHGLDPQPLPFAGRFSGALPGGVADLRRPHASEVAGGPFDEYFHTPDVRRHRGTTGRYNISKLAIHLYRLKSFPVHGVTPFSLGDQNQFTFDPSGRDIPLFNRRNRATDWDEWHSALEWELPMPMRCRLLGHGEYLITEAAIQSIEGLSFEAITDLQKLRNWRFRDETRLRTTLSTLPNGSELLQSAAFSDLLRHTLVEDCGKSVLLPNAITSSSATSPDDKSVAVFLGEELLTAENITAASLKGWLPGPISKQLAVDPGRGRLMLSEEAPSSGIHVNYCYGFSTEMGAGTYGHPIVKALGQTVHPITNGGPLKISDMDMDPESGIDGSGIAQIDDSKTYWDIPDKHHISDLTIQADEGQRPFLRLSKHWVLDTGSNANAKLTLNGLWIGSTSKGAYNIILRGDYEFVNIEYCTLDPGGDVNALGERLFPVSLVVEGHVERLCVRQSIIGPIMIRGNGILEAIQITDSIVQSPDTKIPALKTGIGSADLQRVTVFGRLDVHRLHASEVIITAVSTVADTQVGCFRFSAAPSSSRLPHPYESFLFEKDANHWFTSHRFGQPGYAQLSGTAPEQIKRGAENRSEMGAFCSLFNPIKLDDLKAKIEEYMPFGLIPTFIYET